MKLHIEFLVSRRGLFAGWLLLRLLVGSTAAEFPVNLHAAGDQFAPDVAMDEAVDALVGEGVASRWLADDRALTGVEAYGHNHAGHPPLRFSRLYSGLVH